MFDTETKRKIVNSEQEYVDFVASVYSGWKNRTFEEVKEVHGAPEKFPCKVVAEFGSDPGDDDPEGYGMPGGPSFRFGVEKTVKIFVKF